MSRRLSSTWRWPHTSQGWSERSPPSLRAEQSSCPGTGQTLSAGWSGKHYRHHHHHHHHHHHLHYIIIIIIIIIIIFKEFFFLQKTVLSYDLWLYRSPWGLSSEGKFQKEESDLENEEANFQTYMSFYRKIPTIFCKSTHFSIVKHFKKPFIYTISLLKSLGILGNTEH